MASSSDSTDTVPQFAKDIINTFIEQTNSSFNILLIGIFTAGMLVPLVLSLFIFSNKRSRRSPMFVFIVFIMALGIVDNIWNAVIAVTSNYMR
jgi:hypothetical protein